MGAAVRLKEPTRAELNRCEGTHTEFLGRIGNFQGNFGKLLFISCPI